MARSIQELVGPQDAQHVGPLLANESFRRKADAQLAAADDSAARAAEAASLGEDYAAVVRMFSGAKQQLANIAKKFPESARFTDEASKQLDLAMSASVGDPVPAPGQSREDFQKGLRTGAPATPAGAAQSPFLKR